MDIDIDININIWYQHWYWYWYWYWHWYWHWLWHWYWLACLARPSVIWSRWWVWAASSCSWRWWRGTTCATSSWPGCLSSRRSAGCAAPQHTPADDTLQTLQTNVLNYWPCYLSSRDETNIPLLSGDSENVTLSLCRMAWWYLGVENKQLGNEVLAMSWDVFKVRQLKRVITGKSFGHCSVPETTTRVKSIMLNILKLLPIAPPEGRDAPWYQQVGNHSHPPHVGGPGGVLAVHHFGWHVLQCPAHRHHLQTFIHNSY